MNAPIALLIALTAAQPVPPELSQKKRPGVDPFLPADVRPSVERASEAELDPKRGPGNAVEILKAEKQRFAGDPQLSIAFDLRIAATVLRTKFLENASAPEPIRYAQALSTYSKLDLTDPGLGTWIARTIEHSPDAKAKLGTPAKRKIKLAISAQGSGLDKDAIFSELKRALAGAGVTLEKAPIATAQYAAKLATLEVRGSDQRSTVRATLQLEALDHGKPIWRTSLFRTMEGPEPKAALSAAVDWLVRIGGRDLLFDWLERSGLEGARMQAPKQDHAHDDGHGHGAPPRVATPAPGSKDAPKVRLPTRGGGHEPPPPPRGGGR